MESSPEGEQTGSFFDAAAARAYAAYSQNAPSAYYGSDQRRPHYCYVHDIMGLMTARIAGW